MLDVVKIRLVSPIELGLGLSLAIKVGPKYFPNVHKLFLTPIKPCLCQFDPILVGGRLRRPQTKMGISSGPKNVVHCIIAKLSPSPSSVGLTSIIFTTSSISCGGGVSSPKNEVG